MTSTKDIKLVSDYTGLNFNEVMDLDIYTFKKLLLDAFIDHMSESEEGRDYLERAWILTQTEPDRRGLREKIQGVINA